MQVVRNIELVSNARLLIPNDRHHSYLGTCFLERYLSDDCMVLLNLNFSCMVNTLTESTLLNRNWLIDPVVSHIRQKYPMSFFLSIADSVSLRSRGSLPRERSGCSHVWEIEDNKTNPYQSP